MPLPELTHLQFLVLSILLDGERSGREVRERLKEAGESKSGPAFYQFMARLEDAGFVEGWYDQKVVDGQSIKERRYKITGGGLRAWEEVRDFYLAQVSAGIQGT
jgi:DNA-binding PadR family transcriptional regulator